MRRLMVLAFVGLCLAAATRAQTSTPYQQPSRDIVSMLDAAPFPTPVLSPDGRWVLLAERPTMPTIAELAQPMLRLAGTRIRPNTSAPAALQPYVRLSILDLSSNRTREVALPNGARLAYIEWSPDSRHFAFARFMDDGLELWVADPAAAQARRLAEVRLNAATGAPFQWLPDSNGLLAKLVPPDRGPEPRAATVPAGPLVMQTTGERAPVRTYQDLLESAHDEALFKHYFTARLARVDLASGKVTTLGAPAIFDDVEVSPDGRFVFVSRIVEPFSYFVPFSLFPAELEILDMSGAVVRRLGSLPLAEKVPIGGVRLGPRRAHWKPTAPATLVYAEALDGGDPKSKVPNRDRVMEMSAPFAGEARELFRTEYRFMEIEYGERGDLAVWREFDRPARKLRIYVRDGKASEPRGRLIFDLQSEDRYSHPGSFVETTAPNGRKVVLQSADGRSVYLRGQGATPQGDRPFLRRLSLDTLRAEELFRSADPYYETVLAVLDPAAGRILTSRESVSEPPNLVLRDLTRRTEQALTRFTDPQPALRKLKKELVTYRRSDGIQLSGTLYLPPDYRPGERRPTMIWAYPIEFASADAASQVTGSPNRFTRVAGASHLFLLMEGYVVLDNAAMPILGGDKANDTFVEQLVKNAEAAVNFLVERGVTDRDRIGVGGHSYGAFMTANLLAHSDLFRAGVARSGAYNRTLTPFSFQNEQRTYWEAPEVYNRVSPFMHADKVNEPILLLHGEADNNSGTFPVQSERFYHALKGLGKEARLVMLPHESHGYAARESVLHTIYETINWMNKYVRDAGKQP